jgi:hypothetical protein
VESSQKQEAQKKSSDVARAFAIEKKKWRNIKWKNEYVDCATQRRKSQRKSKANT